MIGFQRRPYIRKNDNVLVSNSLEPPSLIINDTCLVTKYKKDEYEMNAIIDQASIHSLFLSIQNVKKKTIASIPTDNGNKAEIKYEHGFNGS